VEEDRGRQAALRDRIDRPAANGNGGLWEAWRSPAGERVRSFTIITTVPNELCAELHNRMPVVLKPNAWPVWLGEEPANVPQLKALLAGERSRRQRQEQ